MAILSGSTTFGTDFTPAAGLFNVQVTGGPAELWRKASSGSAWALAGQLEPNYAYDLTCAAGAVYKFVGAAPAVPAANQ